MRYSNPERSGDYFEGLIRNRDRERSGRSEYIINNSYISDLFSEYSNIKKKYSYFISELKDSPEYSEISNYYSIEHIFDSIFDKEKPRSSRREIYTPASMPVRQPTEEELREMEAQRKLGELRSQLRTRFDYAVPTSVAEEETQRRLDR